MIEGADPSLAARARSGLGFALLEGGKAEEAAGVFAALQRQNPRRPARPGGRPGARPGARSGEEDRRGPGRLRPGRRGLSRRPSRPAWPTLARARLLVDAGRPDDAAQAFARYVQDDPDPRAETARRRGLDAVLAEWGWALVDAGKAAEADKVFTRLLERVPREPVRRRRALQPGRIGLPGQGLR